MGADETPMRGDECECAHRRPGLASKMLPSVSRVAALSAWMSVPGRGSISNSWGFPNPRSCVLRAACSAYRETKSEDDSYGRRSGDPVHRVPIMHGAMVTALRGACSHSFGQFAPVGRGL